jgi:hypothetical protein
LWKYSWPTTLSMAGEVGVGGGGGAGQHVLRVEDVEALVLHGAHVEVADRHDHEALQVQRQAEARLVPHHDATSEFIACSVFSRSPAAHVHLQQMVRRRGCGCAARAPPGGPATSANR